LAPGVGSDRFAYTDTSSGASSKSPPTRSIMSRSCFPSLHSARPTDIGHHASSWCRKPFHLLESLPKHAGRA
jgi:hypothetical protein